MRRHPGGCGRAEAADVCVFSAIGLSAYRNHVRVRVVSLHEHSQKLRRGPFVFRDIEIPDVALMCGDTECVYGPVCWKDESQRLLRFVRCIKRRLTDNATFPHPAIGVGKPHSSSLLSHCITHGHQLPLIDVDVDDEGGMTSTTCALRDAYQRLYAQHRIVLEHDAHDDACLDFVFFRRRVGEDAYDVHLPDDVVRDVFQRMTPGRHPSVKHFKTYRLGDLQMDITDDREVCVSRTTCHGAQEIQGSGCVAVASGRQRQPPCGFPCAKTVDDERHVRFVTLHLCPRVFLCFESYKSHTSGRTVNKVFLRTYPAARGDAGTGAGAGAGSRSWDDSVNERVASALRTVSDILEESKGRAVLPESAR